MPLFRSMPSSGRIPLLLDGLLERYRAANVLGVRPDLTIAVRRDILDEIDGPMLKHGLQAMAGVSLTLPKRAAQRPDRERVEER